LASAAPARALWDTVPPDANQKLMVRDNGDLIDIASDSILQRDVRTVEVLGNDHYVLVNTQDDVTTMHVVGSEIRRVFDAKVEGIVQRSPNNRFVVLSGDNEDEVYGRVVYDVQAGAMRFLDQELQTTRSTAAFPDLSYHDLTFSPDSRYLAYRE